MIRGRGPTGYVVPEIAALVADAIRFLDGQRYDLLAYCIMSNHAHIVLTPRIQTGAEYYPLAQIMHTIKGYSAGQANRLLGRSGAFWLHESYDHCVRNEAELQRVVAYVVNNPVKAGLVSDWQAWPWTYCREPQANGL